MPTVKIADPPSVCTDQDHMPPSGMALPPGIYKHTCPSCGHVMHFEIAMVYCSWPDGPPVPRYPPHAEGLLTPCRPVFPPNQLFSEGLFKTTTTTATPVPSEKAEK
jgi:hypothetical protein